MPARREDPAIKSGKAKGGVYWTDAAAESAAQIGADALDWDVIPKELDKDAVDKWRELQQRYQDTPLRFHENDRDLLIAFCECWSLRQAAITAVRDEGMLVKGRSGSDGNRLVKSPLLQVIRDQTALLIRLSRELGFGPDAAARAGLKMAREGRADNAYDPFPG